MRLLSEAIVENVCDMIERQEITNIVVDTSVKRLTLNAEAFSELKQAAASNDLPVQATSKKAKKGTISKILNYKNRLFKKSDN